MRAPCRELGVVMLAVLTLSAAPPSPRTDDWPSYGRDPGGMRYSPLTDINRDTVGRLTQAWAFHTGDISDGTGNRRRSGFETTPIVVDGTLYLTTPFNRVIALDPETGQQRWAYDPKVDPTWGYGDGLINRGVATWLDETRQSGQPCRRRVYEATLDARLVSLDGATGLPCQDFGEAGQVSLRDVERYRRGWYHMTSPPVVIDDAVIVGSAIDDNGRAEMPAGVVRGYDARSGALKWKWDPIPPNITSDQPGSPSWKTGAANAWSVMVVDPSRHLVFVPTGSASPDYYGGLRPGDDKWANSIVALDSRSGEVRWAFQLVHHDLWDYDSASPPLLTTVRKDGRDVPVVVQGNKTGFLYVLNRETGTPVFPVEERPVPASDVEGEVASRTQPVPTVLPALAPQRITADDVWGTTPADRDACLTSLAGLRNEGIFTPPSTRGTLAIPGVIGGMNWSGSAFSPAQHLLVVNTNNLAMKVRVIPREEFNTARRTGEHGEYTSQEGAPYGMFRTAWLSPSGLPCTQPPWGRLTALDLATGTIRWQVPLGSFDPSNPKVPTGAISLGGPIVTAGGLVFIAGTADRLIHAFDLETGRELWKAELPAPGHATPMTYKVSPSGRQFVVIAAGGHAKLDDEPQGDALVAFALE